MKKILLYLLAMLLCCFSSCNNGMQSKEKETKDSLAAANFIKCAKFLYNTFWENADETETDSSFFKKQYPLENTLIESRDSINISDSTVQKSLNDIRFEGWKEQDWVDNEYIRVLRKYLDAYNNNEIDDPRLAPYKEKIKGEFVVYNVRPFIMGGLFISIVFIDMPETVFNSWVYSEVDTEKEIITDYVVLSIKVAEEKTTFTKEEILQIIKEHPENKLW